MNAAPGTAVISGAGRGFGAALAAVLAAEGWLVYGIVRPGSGGVSRAGGSGSVRFLDWDIARPCPDDVAGVLAGAGIDVVVNNAAVGSKQKTLAADAPLWSTCHPGWARQHCRRTANSPGSGRAMATA